LSRAIRARYKGGVLVPLDRVDLREDEEVVARIERTLDRENVVEKYKGFMGEIGEEELEELIAEAELERL